MAAVRRLLGLERGGPGACTALALLCGGDYAAAGAESVGPVGALRVVRHLLADAEVRLQGSHAWLVDLYVKGRHHLAVPCPVSYAASRVPTFE